MTPPTGPGIRALQASAPVARLAAGGPGRIRGEIAGVYAHSVSIRARGLAGSLLVNLTASPVEAVCQARVDPSSMSRLRRAAVGTGVLLEIATDDVVATRLVASGVPRDFAAPPSWFDSPQGDVHGRPRLERAARALVADRDVDAPGDLCGLGIGLTPSGDDALVGLVAASACAGLGIRVRRRLAGRLRSGWGERRTTEASLTTLRLALSGDFSPAVGDLLAVLTGTGRVSETEAVDRLARHGYSSGADLMAGIRALARAAVSHTAAHPRGTATGRTSVILEEEEAS